MRVRVRVRVRVRISLVDEESLHQVFHNIACLLLLKVDIKEDEDEFDEERVASPVFRLMPLLVLCLSSVFLSAQIF